MSRTRRFSALLALGSLAVAEPVAAHAGTTHAGTPHWLLGLLALGGGAAVVGGWAAIQDDDVSTRLGVGLLLGGVLAAIFGAIGLVEVQVIPRAAPGWTQWFPVVNLVAGMLLAVGSLVVGFVRWPERPRYVGLGFLLACWIVYPVVMPNEGLTHPLGYLLAAAVPIGVGYVLWRDAGDALPGVFAERVPRAVGAVSFLLFGVFFVFSTGTMSVNPDVTADIAGEGFVTTHIVASPLVYWPAIEFYAPSIPLSGYVSVGLLLLVGLLGGLVAANAALAAKQATAGDAVESPRSMVGAVTAAGATACGCCAPAIYGAAGALFGAAASPVYWAFMDPTSPVGGLFLAASVLLLTGSAIRASEAPACRVRPDDRSTGAATADD